MKPGPFPPTGHEEQSCVNGLYQNGLPLSRSKTNIDFGAQSCMNDKIRHRNRNAFPYVNFIYRFRQHDNTDL